MFNVICYAMPVCDVISVSNHSRILRAIAAMGATRLDGTRGKEQVWRPHIRNRSFGSKCTVLKKVLVTLFGLLGARGIYPRCGRCYHNSERSWVIVSTFVLRLKAVEFF